MAYLNFLASVPDSQVLALQRDATALLRPSLVVGVSHLVAYWVQVQPLGDLLGEALDRGEKLGEEFWHPLREPIFHRPARVRELRRKIADAWEKAKGASQEEWGPYSRDYPYDIRKVLRVFSHAADRGECVVSVLQPPADAERNQQVRTLFVYREQEADESEEGSQAGAGELPEKGYRWPLLSVAGVIGSVGGAVVLGGLAICYWRYRRLSKRQRCNDECQ